MVERTEAECPSDAAGPWRAFLRRGLVNQLVCLGMAAMLWAMTAHGSFPVNWLYSAAIGTSCWFFIDGSRILLSKALYGETNPNGRPRSRWPGPLWMTVCVIGGTVAGYSLGSSVADAITGFSTPSLWGNRPAMAVSLIAAIGATYFFYTAERLRQEQAAAEAARRLAAEAQLKLLESQLEPHMLFNTLANLRVLIGVDATRAQAMLDRLIAFLRATLSASRRGTQPLATEFERLADYLALMAIRMGQRLQVAVDLPEALRELPVPALLLQPLVENAIQHGLEPQVEGGRIEIAARRDGARLTLSVTDSGIGLGAAAAPAPGHGFGTAQVRERLAAQYGAAAALRLEPVAPHGVRAVIEMPIS